LVEWQLEPPLADSPNQALTQRAAETALLDTLKGRAQILGQKGSPLPVTRLLSLLCSGSLENAAAVITPMTEKLTRGIMRKGPVLGLPREAVYTVTHQQPPTLPPPSEEAPQGAVLEELREEKRKRAGRDTQGRWPGGGK